MGSKSYKDIEKQALAQKDDEKLSVVFVLPTLLTGGAERVLITLMNGLDRKRFAPEFIVLNETGELRSWIAEDIPFHSLGNTKIKFSTFKLAKKLNAIAPDIVVSTMAAMNFGLLMTRPLLKKKPRMIVREAVIPSSIIDAQSMSWLVKAAYRNLYPLADMVMAPARCIIDEFESYLGMDTKNYALLHNPVDAKRMRTEKKLTDTITTTREKTVHFVCAGRLNEQKGFDRLIEALPGMKHAYNWRLTILGEGPEHANLEYLVRKNALSDRVTLAGLSQKPWPEIGAADVFLLPSRWEGLPNVVLESLAVGTPVIGMAEAGGIAEIASLSDPGAVTVTDTMRDFVAAMERVKPAPTKTYRPSLLPEYFDLKAVVERFSDLLEQKKIPLKAPVMPKKKPREKSRKFFGRRSAA